MASNIRLPLQNLIIGALPNNKMPPHENKLARPSTPPGIPPPEALRPQSKLSFGVVCSSNINRSMEAHLVLANAGTCYTVDKGIYDHFCLVLLFSRLWRKDCSTHSWNYHWFLCLKLGLRVESYGTGSQVRLPGRSAMEPRIFKFGTKCE